MPAKHASHRLGETCPDCRTVHLTRYDNKPACVGHVTHDRDSYVPGQPRKLLPQPRACRQLPMNGLDVCRQHGGSAAHAKQAGQARQQRMEAEALMLTLGEPVEDAEPGEIIASRIGVRAGHVNWLLARVRELEPDALTWGITKRKTAVERDTDDEDEAVGQRRRFAGTDEGDTHEAKPHIWYALYLAQSRELERLCIEALRVGLDERRVRLAEREGERWVRFIDGVLADLGKDPNDPDTAAVVARHLQAVA